MNRVLKNLSSVVVLIILPSAASVLRAHLASDASPNVIVIFADDLGNGDLGCFDNPNRDTLMSRCFDHRSLLTKASVDFMAM